MTTVTEDVGLSNLDLSDFEHERRFWSVVRFDDIAVGIVS